MNMSTVLPVSSLNHGLSLREKHLPTINLSSPATEVFLDYTVFQPLSLAPNVAADAAETAMLYSHTNIKLIADANNYLLGIVSIRDINGDKMLSTAAAMGIPRQDVTVKDLMTPVSQLQYIKRDLLAHSTVAELVSILENQKQRFLVVIDAQDQLCGLICADEIARLLGRELDTLPLASHFNEVFSALRVHA